jgi:hypothetical protein
MAASRARATRSRDRPGRAGGARTGVGNKLSLWSTTLTLQYQIWRGLVGRLEYRHDEADALLIATPEYNYSIRCPASSRTRSTGPRGRLPSARPSRSTSPRCSWRSADQVRHGGAAHRRDGADPDPPAPRIPRRLEAPAPADQVMMRSPDFGRRARRSSKCRET